MSTGKKYDSDRNPNRGDGTAHPDDDAVRAPADESPESELAAVIADRDANYDRWLRAQAELENFRRRSQREAEEARKYAAMPLLRDFMPGLDNLSRAIAAAQTSQSVDELIKGVQLVSQQFDEVLARQGVVPIAAVGEPFDPNRHEAIQQLPSNKYPAMTVIEEAERGYLLGDRVVRPSKVIVSSGPPTDSTQGS